MEWTGPRAPAAPTHTSASTTALNLAQNLDTRHLHSSEHVTPGNAARENAGGRAKAQKSPSGGLVLMIGLAPWRSAAEFTDQGRFDVSGGYTRTYYSPLVMPLPVFEISGNLGSGVEDRNFRPIRSTWSAGQPWSEIDVERTGGTSFGVIL